MHESIRKLVIAGFMVGALAVLSQPVSAQNSCTYEAGYCNGAGGSITPHGMCPWWPHYYVYFDCYDEEGFVYDGCCYDG